MHRVRLLLFTLGVAASLAANGCGSSSKVDPESITVADYRIEDVVTLGQYTGFEIEYTAQTAVTDEDVEKMINETVAKDYEFEPISDRDTVEDKDIILADYTCKIDGKVVETASGKNKYVEIGSGEYVQGFEKQIIGHKIGTVFDINVKYPNSYQTKELAGKDAVFTIEIKSINRKVPATLSDKYVQSKSETAKTVAEYREEVRSQLQEQINEAVDQYKRQYVTEKAVENAQISSYPEGMVEKRIAEYKNNILKKAEAEKKSYWDYIKEKFNMDERQFDANVKAYIEGLVKKNLVLEAIEKKENLTMTDAEVDEEVEKFYVFLGLKSKEELFKQFKEADIKKGIQQERVLAFLAGASKITTPGS